MSARCGDTNYDARWDLTRDCGIDLDDINVLGSVIMNTCS